MVRDERDETSPIVTCARMRVRIYVDNREESYRIIPFFRKSREEGDLRRNVIIPYHPVSHVSWIVPPYADRSTGQ
jgi:hypothetical protein